MNGAALLFQDPTFAASTPARVRALIGAGLLVALAWSLSTDRTRISWRVIAWGLGLQFAFAVLVLQTPFGVSFFDWMNGLVRALLGYAEQGGRFLFGNLVSDNVPVGALDANQNFVPTQGAAARTGAFFAFRIFSVSTATT